jgi:hypothetical protein
MPELIHSADKSTRLQHIFELNSYALVGGIYLVCFLLVRMVSQLAGEEDMARRVRDIFSMSVQPEQTASISVRCLFYAVRSSFQRNLGTTFAEIYEKQ